MKANKTKYGQRYIGANSAYINPIGEKNKFTYFQFVSTVHVNWGK